MPRKLFVCDPSTPYHVTSRCINRDWFSQPLEEVWDVFSRHLCFATYAFQIRIHAFVLMSNHYHLLVSAPEGNLSEAMRHVGAEVSRDLVKGADRLNHTFVRRFKRCRIGTNQYYLNAYKYIYFNPKAANLIKFVEDYQFSTLPFVLGRASGVIPIDDYVPAADIESLLAWLNFTPEKKKWDAVELALRKHEFKYGKQRTTGAKKMEELLL